MNITFKGGLILMLTKKECTNCFDISHCLALPIFIKSICIFINSLKSDVLSSLSLGRLFLQCTSKFLKTF